MTKAEIARLAKALLIEGLRLEMSPEEIVDSQPIFGEGTDLALLFRGATRGFVQGGFGFAIDAGGYERFWGQKSAGGLGSLVLGAPWGVTLSASAGMGTHDTRFATLTLGLDFARLTVYRTSGTNWFPNPHATDEQGRGPR
jgi:hypothetical protein